MNQAAENTEEGDKFSKARLNKEEERKE